eukprot:TRINITY_DN25828_c0_g1_i2.p1 TRINITY_DN25828_c0_g1~~TRINITY_DN25828_c0_g1_i2.p1  ORF type:complete len:962 (-),score=151.10 TRINITY_DN25828_c0_g1_i2:79-2964(-)
MANFVFLLGLALSAHGQVQLTPNPITWQYEATGECKATGVSRCGPNEWDKVSQACGQKGTQSPINLSPKLTSQGGNVRPLLFKDPKYSCTSEQALEDAHTTEIVFTGDCGKRYGLTYGGKRYSLAQFHFHSPSEHTVDGQHYDAEMHIVSQSEEGATVAIAVFLSLGPENTFLAQFWDEWANLGRKAGEAPKARGESWVATETLGSMDIDAFQAFAGLSGYYMYEGSLTTPPCTGVHWVVFNQAATISLEQLRTYQEAIRAMPDNQLNLRKAPEDTKGAPAIFLDRSAAMFFNDRPVQPLGNRTMQFIPGPLAYGGVGPISHSSPSNSSETYLVQKVVCAVAMCVFLLRMLQVGKRSQSGLYGSMVGDVTFLQLLKDNLRSSITVCLVALPLSIALGIACGTSPTVGLASAVFGGIAAGASSSSKHNVVGPAGALAGMLSMYSLTWGPGVLPWIAIFSSMIIFFVDILGLQRYLLIMPKSVFEGFTVSVAISISGGQINNFLGTVPPHTYKHLVLNIWEALLQIPHCDTNGVVLGSITLVVLMLLFSWKPTQPWLVYGTFVNLIVGLLDAHGYLGLGLQNLASKFGMLSGTFVFQLQPIHEIVDNYDGYLNVFVASASVAYVAILETLISAKVGAMRTGANFNDAKETRGLATAHMICGIAGVMPVTGVFVRTSVNIQSGGSHAISQFMAACFVLAIMLMFMPVFSFLPMAAVASVLFVACIRMVPWGYIKDLLLYSRVDFLFLVITATLSIVFDSSRGLMCGMALALLRNARHQQEYHRPVIHEHGTPVGISVSRPTFRNTCAEDEDSPRADNDLTRRLLDAECPQCTLMLYRPSGPLNYITAEAFLSQAPKGLGQGSGLVLSMEAISSLDMDGVDAMKKLVDSYGQKSVNVVIADFDTDCHLMLKQFDWFTKIFGQGLVFESRGEGDYTKTAEQMAVQKLKDLLGTARSNIKLDGNLPC